MIDVKNASNIKFNNINMMYLKNGAINVNNCKNIIIDGGEYAFTATVKAININIPPAPYIGQIGPYKNPLFTK